MTIPKPIARPKHIVVLMGGFSTERQVSLISGKVVSKALQEVGYTVTTIDVQRNIETLLTQLCPRPDVIFNALHGRYGEDGCIQGLLNILAIPYTHSGLLASALAMNKPMAKYLFSEAGIKTPHGKIMTRDDLLVGDPFPRPYVIKPHNEGSSTGVYIVHKDDKQTFLEKDPWPYGELAMVETFIPGREFTVSIMDERPLAVTEIHTNRTFYDYDAKYANNGSIHTLPADIPSDLYEEIMEKALRAHQILGCRSVSRVDFRYDGNDLFILEVNTQPGMTLTSLVPEQATYIGISLSELCVWMVETAEYDR